jgi:hypothetical protein
MDIEPNAQSLRLKRRRAFLQERAHWSSDRLTREEKRYPGLVVRWGKRTSLINLDIVDKIEQDLLAASTQC